MIELNVNGRAHPVEVRPFDSLADALRERLYLLGTRVSCAAGECGCCTVLVDGVPSTSCLMLAHQAEGRRITTIEGLGSPDALHPLQQAFIDEHGFQCAYCTSGFLMSAAALLAENPDPTEAEVAQGLSGNLCRCGAYPFIVRAVLAAAKTIREDGR